MTDLITRLRGLRERGLPDDVRLIGAEAANEIERLRARLNAAHEEAEYRALGLAHGARR